VEIEFLLTEVSFDTGSDRDDDSDGNGFSILSLMLSSAFFSSTICLDQPYSKKTHYNRSFHVRNFLSLLLFS
jgi:hypothetical protein